MLLATALLLGSASQASAANVAEWIFDVMVLRPGGVIATVGGAALFGASAVVLAPFDFFDGNFGSDWPRIDNSLDAFVLGPTEYTFERPIGEF